MFNEKKLVTMLLMVSLIATIIIIMSTTFVFAATPTVPGRAIVNHDDWAFSDTAFSIATTDPTNIIKKSFAYLVKNKPGAKILVYTEFDSYYVKINKFIDLLRAQGYNVTVQSSSTSYTLDMLKNYDALFLGGASVNNTALIDYLKADGGIFISGGTGYNADGSADASRWNTFLTYIGLKFETANLLLGGGIDTFVPYSYPQNSGKCLYFDNGNKITILSPVNPNINSLMNYGGYSLLAIYNAPKFVTDVTVNPETALMFLGNTGNISATISPDDVYLKEVTWASSSPSKVGITNTGTLSATVNANAVGQSTIMATSVGDAVDIYGETCKASATSLITVMDIGTPPATNDVYNGKDKQIDVPLYNFSGQPISFDIWTTSDNKSYEAYFKFTTVIIDNSILRITINPKERNGVNYLDLKLVAKYSNSAPLGDVQTERAFKLRVIEPVTSLTLKNRVVFIDDILSVPATVNPTNATFKTVNINSWAVLSTSTASIVSKTATNATIKGLKVGETKLNCKSSGTDMNGNYLNAESKIDVIQLTTPPKIWVQKGTYKQNLVFDYPSTFAMDYSKVNIQIRPFDASFDMSKYFTWTKKIDTTTGKPYIEYNIIKEFDMGKMIMTATYENEDGVISKSKDIMCYITYLSPDVQ